MALQTANPQADVVRRSGNFTPPLWGDRFASFSVDNKVIKSYDEEIKMLKEIVKNMLMASTSDPLDNVCFIDLLSCLGVSYHFESEIQKQLKKAFHVYANLIRDHVSDLYTVALLFRVFRQHGYNVPSDVFKKFQDSGDKFKEDLSRDAKGMLSLYEASQLVMHGEYILEEALAFTKTHLESLATQSISPHHAKRIKNALYRPLHKCIPRLATKQFIAFYEEDDSRNETLLQFAKVDFNRLQLLYQEELCQLTRWYRNLGIPSNLPYARDRIVEVYLCWGLGTYFQPQYSNARIIITKAVEIMSVLDDTYDMMDRSAVDELPDYMKYLYRLLLDMFDEWDKELAKEGVSFNTSYVRDSFKQLVRGYLVEGEWCDKDHVPTVEEYVSNALITSTYTAIAMSSFLGMGEVAGARAFEWIKTAPKIHVGSQKIGRLVNDIMSHEAEQKRGHVASFIECYMKQYGVPEKEAIKACKERVDDAWKDINEDFMRPTLVSMPVLMRIVNLARAIEVAYRDDDGYTNPEVTLQYHIDSLLLQHIPL